MKIGDTVTPRNIFTYKGNLFYPNVEYCVQGDFMLQGYWYLFGDEGTLTSLPVDTILMNFVVIKSCDGSVPIRNFSMFGEF